jgi:hypothetical protein
MKISKLFLMGKSKSDDKGAEATDKVSVTIKGSVLLLAQRS